MNATTKNKQQGTSVISPIIPLVAVVLAAFIISQKSVDHVFETYPSLYIITFGMVSAKVTNKLVVSRCNSTIVLSGWAVGVNLIFVVFFSIFLMQIAHMTKSEMGYSDYGHFGPILLFLNQYFNNFLPEFYVLCIALIWCTYDLLIYCAQVSWPSFTELFRNK